MCKKLFCEIFLSVYLLFAKDVSFYQVITYGYCHFDYYHSELHWGFNRNGLATEANNHPTSATSFLRYPIVNYRCKDYMYCRFCC